MNKKTFACGIKNPMNIVKQTGTEDIATLYIGEFEKGKLVEFVESVHPPRTSDIKKVVFIVSTLNGCPVGCRFCDASNYYKGKLTKEEIFAQIDYLAKKRFGSSDIDVEKFKIQFSRMGEPSFNPAVLDVLKEIPARYRADGLLVSLSTIAPIGAESFFEKLLNIKNKLYKNNFQLQFSLHSTDLNYRKWLIPVNTWSMEQIASYADRFYTPELP
jgi:23S rRNA (adenine2503-C2)-methyltransferase